MRAPRGGSAAAFARANSPLYIESVYDGHFGLAQIGKNLTAGYRKLGGAAAFGKALTRGRGEPPGGGVLRAGVAAASAPGVKLGS